MTINTTTVLQLPIVSGLDPSQSWVPVAVYVSGSWVLRRATVQQVAGIQGSTTVASLPSAATVGAGARYFVTDANSTTFLATAVGGGSNKVPVVSNGTDWVIG